jgi:radical SAM protein with 4Fe4S-binding SPASM domain
MNNDLHKNIAERYNIELSIEPPFPTKRLKIEVSNHCNHRCIFCSRNKAVKLGGLIDQTFYARIMKEAFDEGVREVGLFINGEPFTHPHLEDFVLIAKQIGYEYIYLTTNGSLATPERLTAVIDAGLSSIKFSINAATRENYAKIHGRDDFEKVIENLKFTREYRNSSGKHYNIFGSFVVIDITSTETDLFKERYGNLFDDLAFYKCRSNGIMSENVNLSAGGLSKQSRCTLPFNTINIDVDGHLLACCEDINHKIVVADLNKVTLKEAWYNETMRRIRQMHIDMTFDGTICKECLAGGGGVVEILKI